MNVINKIGIAVIKNRKLLMVRSYRNESVFYILGGKPEEGETEIDCLIREIDEEVSGTLVQESLLYLSEFQAESHDKPNTIVKLKLYMGDVLGRLEPNNEIAEIDYFDSNSDPKHLSELTKKIISWLANRCYIA